MHLERFQQPYPKVARGKLLLLIFFRLMYELLLLLHGSKRALGRFMVNLPYLPRCCVRVCCMNNNQARFGLSLHPSSFLKDVGSEHLPRSAALH